MTAAILQIAVGIWLGGLFLVGTLAGWSALRERIERNQRLGRPWYRYRWSM